MTYKLPICRGEAWYRSFPIQFYPAVQSFSLLLISIYGVLPRLFDGEKRRRESLLLFFFFSSIFFLLLFCFPFLASAPSVTHEKTFSPNPRCVNYYRNCSETCST